jgi:hypothetical protein
LSAWSAAGRAKRALALALMVASANACSPAMNWRELRVSPDEAGLMAAWPCRPEVQVRDLTLVERQVRMSVQMCEAEGVMFAVLAVDMGDPSAVRPALAALADGFRHQLGSAAAARAEAFAPLGMSRQPEAGRWVLQGMAPDGRVRHAEMAVLTHGTWVFQATMLAPTALPPEAVQPFFEGLKLAP